MEMVQSVIFTIINKNKKKQKGYKKEKISTKEYRITK